jgi:uncharacterized protein YbjT (DUF2867 family)
MSTQNILVVGATGQQGGAVVKALLDLPQAPTKYHVLALTRDPQSPHAKALASAHGDAVELVQGDSTNPEPVFDSKPNGSIAGLFIVTAPAGTRTSEEKQGIPLIDAAVAHGVKHIVFSSVDRGGDDKSWTNPTTIKRFRDKHNIELYLHDKAKQAAGTFSWTILRPVSFLDNLNPGWVCSIFTAMWDIGLRQETKLQMVSVKDIGVFAAKAFDEPARWSGKAVGLAGDELTLGEARDKFERLVGKNLPETWAITGMAVLWASQELGDMFAFFENEGYGVDIEALRREGPTQDFESWLQESSKWLKE